MNLRAEESAALVRADVLVLLREKRYEEALARLYQARAESPTSLELQKGIDQVKEFLIGAYAKRLGGLDQIAQPIVPTAGRSPDVVLLSRYIDGTSSYGDLAEICPLGRLRTLQVLIEMYAPKPLPVVVLPRELEAAAGGEPEAPRSQARPLEFPPASPPGPAAVEPLDAPPETERSASSPPSASPDEGPDAREYREAFGRGTAAFIQRRFAEAIEAFDVCAGLRPGDAAAAVMLRRARRDLEGQS